ncbi:PREDICTED: plant UBX domain-containing protein 4-like [Nicotiana attenuata]|uniref:Plant ubx domain-containing protein 4 n=1 Tax=Nicotiana attenuata TaxID=49451 RepID=A0A1J6I6I9_NICAT|nr:PREDICTED: plant UBX domain-containing protein 4-like [Nicotiana attenuata]OIT00130.1 plant ubx domain-containing protein 4 [Nicotiana attenuata]
MENQANLSADPQREALVNTFCEITSASKPEALFFLESHNFDLDSAVSTFFENNTLPAAAADEDYNDAPASAAADQRRSPSRSRSPSPPRPRNPPTSSGAAAAAAGRRTGGIHTFSDLNRRPVTGSGSDSDEHQEYYTGGEKSGMLVQDPSKANNVDAIFDQARQYAAVEAPPASSGSRSFSGTARRLTGETVSAAPQPPESITHVITFWINGFTIDDGPLRRFDDPENASFLESIRKSECPKELEPEDRRTSVRVNLTRREEDCPVPEKRRATFQGVGRTLGSTSNAEQVESIGAVSSFTVAPTPSVGLVVDQSQPSTSIQLRLADGTRMVSRFNFQHTIRDIRGFIDASRPGGPRSYQLQTVGFPPKQLSDLDQTIEQAGLANSVVIQKL